MNKRPLGQTGLMVSELGLGTWGLSGDAYGPVDEVEQDAIIRRALGLGITLIETAGTYAQGSTEKRIGAIVADTPGVTVVTKVGTDLEGVPARKRFDRTFLHLSCERSADRLRRASLDVVLLHNPAAVTLQQGEACAALKEMRERGSIRAWGVSAGDAEVARAALEQGAEVVQLAYNPMLRSDLEQLPWSEPQPPGILARSVLAHGMLAGQWSESKVFPRRDHRSERWTEEQLAARVRQLPALTAALSTTVPTLRAVAVRFALSNPRVSCAVLGPKSTLQLDQLVREAGSGPTYLEPRQLERLRGELERHGARP